VDSDYIGPMSSHLLELPLPPFVSRDEATLLLAVKLFETGRLSLGQAARLCGHSRAAFIDELSRLGVPVLNSEPGELADETAW
jgi:predicted HTH domain antitoxin